MIVKLLTEHHSEFLSLKGGCTGSSESTHIKMPHCWKSHATAQLKAAFIACNKFLRLFIHFGMNIISIWCCYIIWYINTTKKIISNTLWEAHHCNLIGQTSSKDGAKPNFRPTTILKTIASEPIRSYTPNNPSESSKHPKS